MSHELKAKGQKLKAKSQKQIITSQPLNNGIELTYNYDFKKIAFSFDINDEDLYL